MGARRRIFRPWALLIPGRYERPNPLPALHPPHIPGSDLNHFEPFGDLAYLGKRCSESNRVVGWVIDIHPRFPPARARRHSKLIHRARTWGTLPSVLLPPASRYHDVMAKQTTVRLPDDLAEEAEAVARVNGISVNALIIESLSAEIARVRADKEFTTRVSKLLKRDKELLDRLAR
jgi:hypothetical protein